MSHPITDILRQVLDGDDTALDAFKRQLWHRPFWVAGTNKLVDGQGLQIYRHGAGRPASAGMGGSIYSSH
jgi:hypothetical protein